ncbi:MAG: hypothetical protein WCX69_04960 [Candidatus Paceibacterota bacterium]
MDPNSLLPALNQTCLFQFVKVVRNKVLRQTKMFNDFASAVLATFQNANDFESVALGKQFQKRRDSRDFRYFTIIFTALRFHISIYIDIVTPSISMSIAIGN